MASQNRALNPKTRAQFVGIGILLVLAMIVIALTTNHRLELRGTISAGPPITDPQPLGDLCTPAPGGRSVMSIRKATFT